MIFLVVVTVFGMAWLAAKVAIYILEIREMKKIEKQRNNYIQNKYENRDTEGENLEIPKRD